MDLEPVTRLSKDIATAAKILSKDEARFLVDAYYQMQDDRIRSNNQVRALTESREPNDVLKWLAAQAETLEGQLKRALTRYAEASPVGEWAMSQIGIGPVITAGLLAHIDITKAPTAGHIWSFAGQNPDKVWEKGQKRPWNADLKRLCWIIGESFVKFSSHKDAFYGRLYTERKEHELRLNGQGAFKEQAAKVLSNKNFARDTKAKACYLAGKLPPAHIHARAKRYAVKIFLSHLHHVWYRHHYKTEPPKPFAIAQLGHAHMIEPLNIPESIRQVFQPLETSHG